MRVLATTVHRMSTAEATHGYLLEIDWDQKRVVKRMKAPPLWSQFGERDRGGRRGLRGIAFYKGLIWVASCEVIYGFDPETMELDCCISHRYMSHIHEIEAVEEGIWVTSTGGDGVFLINEDQQVLCEAWACEPPNKDLRVHLERSQQVHHINTVCFDNGEVFAYGLKTGLVFRMYPGPVEPVFEMEKGCHNVVKTAYGWFANLSIQTIVRVGERELQLPRRGPRGRYTRPGWLRGLAWLSESRVLVGSSPATLFEIDLEEMRLVDEMQLEKDVCWTVHGIYADQHVPSAVADSQAAGNGLHRMVGSLRRLLRPGREA